MLPNIFSYTTIVKGMSEFSDLSQKGKFIDVPAGWCTDALVSDQIHPDSYGYI